MMSLVSMRTNYFNEKACLWGFKGVLRFPLHWYAYLQIFGFLQWMLVHRMESTTLNSVGCIPEALLGPTVGAGNLSGVFCRRTSHPISSTSLRLPHSTQYILSHTSHGSGPCTKWNNQIFLTLIIQVYLFFFVVIFSRQGLALVTAGLELHT